jgi:hypothetical protein
MRRDDVLGESSPLAVLEVYIRRGVCVVPLRIGCTELYVPHLTVNRDMETQRLDSGSLSNVR